MFSSRSRLSRNGKHVSETFKSAILTGTLESSENSSSSSTVHRSEGKPVVIVGRHDIYSVAFLGDRKHIVSGGEEGNIRLWRRLDGREVGTPMNAKSEVNNIAVLRGEKWIVSGTYSGELAVWDAQSQKKVTEWKGHSKWVYAVDISPDEGRIATGSGDETACVWSFSQNSLTPQRLLGPLEHSASVIVAKFSPDGSLISTATWRYDSIRVYKSQNGLLLIDVPIRVAGGRNQSLVWVSDSKHLFALSLDGKINYLDVSTGSTLFSWPIHPDGSARCIALASDGTFIAASAGSSVSFWDTTSHKQIGSLVKHTDHVMSMAVSENYDLVLGGRHTITLWNIYNVLPLSSHKNVSALV